MQQHLQIAERLRILKDNGAQRVLACAVHGVLSGPAVFAAAYGYLGSYAETLYTMAVIGAGSIAALWIAQRRALARPPVWV